MIGFKTPRDYFELNAGRVQISSMRDISESTWTRNSRLQYKQKALNLSFKHQFQTSEENKELKYKKH